MGKKGAIELSMNFIVVIIISVVIVFGGLIIFFRAIDNARELSDKIDMQTESKIKDMMLSGNYRVAAYPQDLTIDNGYATLIGIGITNNIATPKIFNITIPKIVLYINDSGPGKPLSSSELAKYRNNINWTTTKIDHGEQIVRGILLSMPKNATNGQYVYTINISTTLPNQQYGIVQVYVTNP